MKNEIRARQTALRLAFVSIVALCRGASSTSPAHAETNGALLQEAMKLSTDAVALADKGLPEKGSAQALNAFEEVVGRQNGPGGVLSDIRSLGNGAAPEAGAAATRHSSLMTRPEVPSPRVQEPSRGLLGRMARFVSPPAAKFIAGGLNPNSIYPALSLVLLGVGFVTLSVSLGITNSVTAAGTIAGFVMTGLGITFFRGKQ